MSADKTPDENAGTKKWAIVRILLGTSQVVAAATTFLLYLWTVAGVLTLSAGAAALALFLLSKRLFRGVDE